MRKLLLLLWGAAWFLPVCAQPDTVKFDLLIETPSLEAIDDYPQCVTRISREDAGYRIALTVVSPYADGTRKTLFNACPYTAGAMYAPEIGRYLESTPLIDAGRAEIALIADTLLGGMGKTGDIIRKGLAFVHGLLTYDDSLVLEIDAGRCRTLDAGTVLDRRRGTCSEYTNLFAALMRCKGIPTRFAVGYVFMPERNYRGTHAWAECYVEGIGWCAVDPQNGSAGFPHGYVLKMRHGLDYEDCRIRTLDRDIEPLEIVRTYPAP